MNDDRKAIIEKILKCLALAKSSNEHEAAVALRQAQKLMQMHGICDLDIEHADIQEEGTRAGAAKKPASWECALADRVANAFGCSVYLAVGWNGGRRMFVGTWMFVGAAPSAEIARYAFEVMFRQLKRARANHIKTALKRCSTTRTRRADLFCEGWVKSATALIERFAGNVETQARITAYLEHKHPNMQTSSTTNRNAGRNLSERDYGDLVAGHRAGKSAQLNHGVNGAAAPLALE